MSGFAKMMAGTSEFVYATLVGAGKVVERKVVGALLIAVLVAASLSQLGNHLYEDHHPEESAFRVLTDEAEGPAVAEVEEEVIDILPLIATASADDGQTLFARRCTSCHTVEAGGANKVGPNLWNRLGGAKGGTDGFAYSSVMAESGGEWTFESLSEFLTAPKEFMAGTKMNFAGLRKPADRAAIIAYLRLQADNPLPLP